MFFYITTELTFHNQPNKPTRDTQKPTENYINPPDTFANSSAVALRQSDDEEYDENGELVNSQTVSSKTRTVETLTVSI